MDWFSQLCDECFNMDYECKLENFYYSKNIFDNFDLSGLDSKLVVSRSRHAIGADECFRVFSYVKEDWSIYSSVKAMYYIAFIQLKFSELEILDQLYDTCKAAVACEKLEHFYYPSLVVWKTRNFILQKCELENVAQNLFNGYLLARPEEGKDMYYYGSNIAYNMKLILSASHFINKIPFEDLGYFKSLIEMTVEVLENITIKVCALK